MTTNKDLLCIRLDDRTQDVVNKRVSEAVVLDIGEKNRIIGIEIIDASKHVTSGYPYSLKEEMITFQ